MKPVQHSPWYNQGAPAGLVLEDKLSYSTILALPVNIFGEKEKFGFQTIFFQIF